MNHESDLTGCLQGDKDAWDRFVDRTYGLVFAAVHRTFASYTRRPDRSEVEDVVQNVYLRLIRNDCRLLRRFDRERGTLTTWLSWIARSAAIDQLRGRRHAHIPLDNVGELVLDEPDENTEDPPFHLLTGRQRLVLRLLFDEGRTCEEAARILGVSTQTVYSTKNKAISRLREHLGQNEPTRGASSGRLPVDGPYYLHGELA